MVVEKVQCATHALRLFRDSQNNIASKIKTKKTFKPTHIPRYLRGQVKERLLKTDLENYNKHRRNVFYVKPIVDCKPPPMNPNVYCNTKRLEIDEHRVRQINQENVEMVKRINKINRFGSNLDTFNRLAYVRNKEWWELHKKEMQRIVVDNRKIYVSIKKAVNKLNNYLSKNYDEFWNRVLRKLQNTTKYPLILFDKKPLDVLVREQRSISDGQCVEEKPRCFMDFRVKDGVYLGRIVIELYHNYVPVTVQNFLSICSNQDGLTYKHSEIHKIYANSHMDLGDITKGNGKGGISIYGDTFAEENHVLKHTRMDYVYLQIIPFKKLKMLYLEDYLEMIEHLPQELRDRFSEMREMDLSVQNTLEELDKRVRLFFSDCKRYPNELPPSLDIEFQEIRKEYYKSLEDADEKVHLANQMYELVDKYLRRLDTELHKFKCELEADNKGITEVLEKRSLELDSHTIGQTLSTIQQKENRFERESRPRNEKRRDSSSSIQMVIAEKRQAIAPVTIVEPRHTTIPQTTTSTPQPTVSYNISHIGAGPAIAAAASQAIAATQQMQQGRRTASLKASYEAINTGVHVNEFGIGRELAGAAQTAIQAIQQDHNNKKKQKKWTATTSTASNTSTTSTVQAVLATPPVASPAPASPQIETTTQTVDGGEVDWTYDPNEPRYCICNQVSYGDMVACDNEDVSILNNAVPLLICVPNLVSFRVVPLPLRGHYSSTKRKVVLSSMHNINEA
ncbi:hypothetical protein FQR65_LT08997 [Abscondita terminalis]|nr:hypothetical protein FQR65_LT08997 [Abscondita terminalis]